MRFLADSWASTTHVYLDLRVFGLFSPQASRACKARLNPRRLQPFTRVFHGVVGLHVVRIDETNTYQHSSMLSSAGRNFWSQMIGRWCCLNFCQPPPRPRVSVWMFFIPYCELRDNGPKLRLVPVQNNRQYGFPTTHPVPYSSAWPHQCTRAVLGMILHSARGV